jgi:hypothetical protein
MAVQTDPGVVRLLARHFNDMQGLRSVLVGVVALLVTTGYLVTRNDIVGVFLLLPAFLALALGMRALDRFYARQFGRVPVGPRRSILIGGALGILSGIDTYLHGFPSVCWSLWALWPAWFVYDCWPLRRYHLLSVAAALYLAITHVRVPAISATTWMAQGMLILAWTLIATGLADHLLLARLMRQPPQTHRTTDTAEESIR